MQSHVKHNKYMLFQAQVFNVELCVTLQVPSRGIFGSSEIIIKNNYRSMNNSQLHFVLRLAHPPRFFQADVFSFNYVLTFNLSICTYLPTENSFTSTGSARCHRPTPPDELVVPASLRAPSIIPAGARSSVLGRHRCHITEIPCRPRPPP